jgi:hypothetical protein
MPGWAGAAWLAGVAAALAAAWMGRRWRRSGTDALPGSRVARHRYGDPSTWPLLLGGLAMLTSAALRISQDPTGPRRVIEVVALVVGAVALTVGVAGLLIQRHWNRRRSGEGTDRHPS